MNDQQTWNPASKNAGLICAAILVALLALWGYLRGFGGQVGSAIEGVKQLAPKAEERNRLVRELANQPKGDRP